MWNIKSKTPKRLNFLLTGILIIDTALNSVPFLSDGININHSMYSVKAGIIMQIFYNIITPVKTLKNTSDRRIPSDRSRV